jgi:cyclic beta-1,2-glucan synthetase
LPIITITIKYLNDVYVIKEVLKMYEYLRTKNLKTELVIIDEEKYSYENYLKNEIENAIQNSQLAYLKNIFGGIFTLSRAEMNQQDLEMIKFICLMIN